MATVLPSPLPDKATTGEKIVIDLMGNLPGDCIVYYEPSIQNKCPDIIVIIPDMGVIVIEVKDWAVNQIIEADNNEVKLRVNATIQTRANPIRQSKDYMHDLRDACRSSSAAKLLLHDGGTFESKFIFPFTYLAIFTNITAKELSQTKLKDLFPPGQTLTSDELKTLRQNSGGDLKRALAKYFTVAWNFEPLNDKQLSALRGVIDPRVVIASTSDEISVLDLEQEDWARKGLAGHRVLKGVTGSGKTVVLIARAKFLAADNDGRILVLCYNRLLSEYIKHQLSSFTNIEVSTFQAWGRRNGVVYQHGEEDAAFGARLLNVLKNPSKESVRYNAVLVDEAQDFCKEWIICGKLALRDPEKGHLFIVGDGTQKLARQQPYKWIDAGIQARGRRTRYFRINYRNTQNILKSAAGVLPKHAGMPPEDDDGDAFPDTDIEWKLARRHGPSPAIVSLKSRAAECSYAAALVESWLLGGIDLGGQHKNVRPKDIAILYPARREIEKPAFDMLRKRLEALAPVAVLRGADARGSLRDNSIKLTTMQSVKGLEFPFVILLWTDMLCEPWFSKNFDCRRLLFVSLTRAQQHVTVLHSADCALIDQARESERPAV